MAGQTFESRSFASFDLFQIQAIGITYSRGIHQTQQALDGWGISRVGLAVIAVLRANINCRGRRQAPLLEDLLKFISILTGKKNGMA